MRSFRAAFMNSGSFELEASIASVLTMMWPFSPHAEDITGRINNRRIAINRRMCGQSLAEFRGGYNQSVVLTLCQISFEIQRGDISTAKVDAVVNAANNH